HRSGTSHSFSAVPPRLPRCSATDDGVCRATLARFHPAGNGGPPLSAHSSSPWRHSCAPSPGSIAPPGDSSADSLLPQSPARWLWDAASSTRSSPAGSLHSTLALFARSLLLPWLALAPFFPILSLFSLAKK